MTDTAKCSADPAACAMIDACREDGVSIIWDRVATMMPQCRYGVQGICCRICTMGPCRINPQGKNKVGICGATADTIAARNLVRMIAGGVSAHSDHGRGVAHTLLMASEGKGDYKIRDEVKLRSIAREFGVPEKGKAVNEVAKGVAEAVLGQYGQQEGELTFALRAPADQLKRWRENGVVPRGMDREVVDIMHRTTMGVDSEFHSVLHQGVRAALADGWSGSMVATDLSDVLFGTPDPIRSRVNLGVLDAKKVNILVHGHEPLLSEMIVVACQDPELVALAKSKGATGINLAGICCTANEILMRHGVPVAGNFLHQELAVATGVVDAMVVDVQCVMPGLGDLGTTFHTKFISTSKMARFATTDHIEFDEANALASAKKIVRAGIENYPNRKGRAMVPDVKSDMVAGFTAENIATFLGGKYRATYRPLNDAVMSGRWPWSGATIPSSARTPATSRSSRSSCATT
jgi:carbon-monoxide dehydrogenase catalytic subunit